MIVGALGVLLALAAGCSSSSGSGPVHVAPPEVAPAARAQCAALHERLPRRLDPDVRSRPTTPASPLTAAWGDPAIILRCGVAEPAGYRVGAQALQVDAVQWFRHDAGAVTEWTTVDRPVYVEVALPAAYQAELLTELTAAITGALPAVTPSPRTALPTPP